MSVASPLRERSVGHSHSVCIFSTQGCQQSPACPSWLLSAVCNQDMHTLTHTHTAGGESASCFRCVFLGGLEFSPLVWLLGDAEVITLSVSIVWCCVTGVTQSLCEWPQNTLAERVCISQQLYTVEKAAMFKMESPAPHLNTLIGVIASLMKCHMGYSTYKFHATMWNPRNFHCQKTSSLLNIQGSERFAWSQSRLQFTHWLGAYVVIWWFSVRMSKPCISTSPSCPQTRGFSPKNAMGK